MAKFAQLGVTVYGGCCGTTPAHIKAAYDLLEQTEIAKRENIRIPAAVCSASEVVLIDQPRIIGERINPTGKKLMKEALRRGDVDYMLDQAWQQMEAGADILDVNVGLPEIDEAGHDGPHRQGAPGSRPTPPSSWTPPTPRCWRQPCGSTAARPSSTRSTARRHLCKTSCPW